MNNQNSRFDRLLTYTFMAIMIIQVGYLLIGFASIPRYYQRITTQAVEPVTIGRQVQYSNTIVTQMAARRGLSLGGYAVYRIIVNSVAALIPLAVALIMIWRARRQWFAWFTAAIIVFLGVSALSEQTLIAQFISVKLLGINDIFWFLVLLYVFLFPNGRAVPRRVTWLVIALVAYHLIIQAGTVIAYFAPDLATRLDLPNWGKPVFIWPVLLNFVIILACQVYRYRRVSTPIERQQTKWFLFGFGWIIALIPVSIFVDSTSRDGFLKDFAELVIWIPLYFSLAIAILRYRLFDIDILIRRTLVYSILTVLLGLVYFGGVTILQGVVQAVSGKQSAASIVVSTLVIAALFNPLRKAIQNFIDRRFYRRKYDAERALAIFAAAARSETDLINLTDRLMGVVQQTLQPETTFLWIKTRKESRTVERG